MIPLCRHVMNTGLRCQCPAMRRKRYCYAHQRAREYAAKITAERARQRWFKADLMSNRKAVQRALSEVMTRILEDEIDHKQAGRILEKLELASSALRRTGQKCGSNGQGVAPSAKSRG